MTLAKIIEYNDVEVLRKELVVLKHVSFSLEEGEFAYLIGRVGSGKSSLMKSMYAEIPLSGGHANVLGRELIGIRRKEIPMLRREIGIVFQDFQLLTDRTVQQNLEFVLNATGWRDRTDKENRIEQCLRQVGMENKSYKLPHELSGGEQQRVVIARALLNKPRLILADEPTGNLDPETGQQIFALLRRCAEEGTAVIMATHNLALVEQYPARTLRCEAKALHTS
ncbi:ATP-binding cassette domain-containing protein [Muribaculaceae bacterium Isolate-013 (NCI)]|nr:ATP-binding cassette domain-containing protein [Muribaculaceae bacterium Isolate-013 (NCI)]